MKIVIGTSVFYPYFDTGGVVHTFNVARWLVKFGHEVTVLCDKTSLYSNAIDPMLPEYEEVEGIKIIRSKRPYNHRAIASSLPALLEQYSQLKKMIRNNDVDIVNAVTYRSCLPLITAAKSKVPCIATIHAILLNGGFLGFEGWQNFESGKISSSAIAGCLIENMMVHLPYDGLMTTSDWMKEEMSRYYPKKRINVIYGGVDLGEIDKVASNSKAPNQIVFLGSVIKHKNILDAIEATRLARREIEDLKLVIVSSGGEYEEMIKVLCNNNKFIEYHKRPRRDQIYKILKESCLLIHPSKSENFALASIEALACGTPFVGYDVLSMREIVQHTQGGELVPYKDIEALSLKICELHNDKGKRNRLARQGRDAVENKYTWEKTARRVEETFEGFVDETNRIT
jgi:glycosyltransferase involved in cell wall biosynthesis